MMRTAIALGLAAGCLLAGPVAAGEAAGADAGAGGAVAAAGELPVNKWVKLSSKSEPGYVWSAPVYAPGRNQVLLWGSTHPATGGCKWFWNGTSRNDVIAFDPEKRDWLSDYPSDEKAKAAIAGVYGNGAMLPSGRPAPAHVLNGVCWDSKRGRAVYTMKGLMAAYDPGARTWKDLGARTVMPFPACDPMKPSDRRTEFPGGPPVYGVGTCYDPVNDEILLFPHFDAKNIALREATGRITGHYGTFRYSFKDNAWRMVGETFGSDETKAARKELVAAMAAASSAMDAAWALRHRPDAVKAAEVAKQLESVEGCEAPVAGKLKAAAAALAAGKPAEAIEPLREALWAMDDRLENALRVEPPPRSGAPMVYDAGRQAIVMFGGHTNLARTDLPPKAPNVQDYTTGLNDTWVYDCRTRQWREIASANRPPAGIYGTKGPMLAWDPASGLVVLVALVPGDAKKKTESKVQLWTLDVAKGEWARRDEQPWIGGLPSGNSFGGSTYPGTYMPTSVLALDPERHLLVMVQPGKGEFSTYGLRLDLGKLPSEPAPAWTAPPPIRPQTIPPDDPEWVAKLKALPANTWVRARPPAEPCERGWGNLSVDAERGWVVYFGGGHATYQVNDVAVYAPGANVWVPAAGDFNSNVTPQGWEGSTLGYRGGPACGHQRNAYQSFDGRMYLLLGTDERTSEGSMGNPWNFVFHADRDFVRFYDIDRGGVWRETRISRIERPEKVPYQTNVHLADPGGRIINLIRQGGGAKARMLSSVYDVYEDRLTVREVPAPLPAVWDLGESRGFCCVAGKSQVFYMTGTPDADAPAADARKPPMKQVTWLFDWKENKFTELAPRHTPPAAPVKVVEHVAAQNCAMAVIGDEQWVYSFERNDWAELPVAVDGGGKMAVTGPYGQMVWVEKHGVFVNFDRRATWVMRPDFGKVAWQ